jgi:hypothetical protein
MTIPTPIATAADYADALLTARRFKNALFWILLLILLTQLTVFLLAKYSTLVLPDTTAPTPTLAVATTQPLDLNPQSAIPNPQSPPAPRTLLSLALQYLIGLTDFIGLVSSLLFSLTLLLMLSVLIQGRLLGVSQLTSAFITSLLLALLLFPWQAFLNFSDLDGATFRLPGVLYTWPELVRESRFEHLSTPAAVLKWARFLGFPLAAIFLLLSVQSKSRRALRRALGEIDYATPPWASPAAPPPPAAPPL